MSERQIKIESLLVVADRIDSYTLSALDRAAKLAPSSLKKVKLLGFVYESFVEAAGVLTPAEQQIWRGKLIGQRRHKLESLLQSTGLADLEITLDVLWASEGDRWKLIQTHEEKSGLIIKTANRDEKLWYMPTDWKLLRYCRSPVYLAGRAARLRSGPILATVDMERSGRIQPQLNTKVLENASTLARQLGVELHVCQVIAAPTYLNEKPVELAQLMKNFKKLYWEELCDMAAQYGIAEPNIHLLKGPIHTRISGLATRIKADMVVVGSIGRKGIKGILLGNTAEQIISMLRMDVLVIKP